MSNLTFPTNGQTNGQTSATLFVEKKKISNKREDVELRYFEALKGIRSHLLNTEYMDLPKVAKRYHISTHFTQEILTAGILKQLSSFKSRAPRYVWDTKEPCLAMAVRLREKVQEKNRAYRESQRAIQEEELRRAKEEEELNNLIAQEEKAKEFEGFSLSPDKEIILDSTSSEEEKEEPYFSGYSETRYLFGLIKITTKHYLV